VNNDPALMNFFLERVALYPHPVIIDVGANVGMFASLPYTIYAFEPHPDAYRELRENAPDAVTYRLAVGETHKTAILRVPPSVSDSVVSTLGTPYREHDDWQEIEVEVVPLDEFAFPRIDLIKIDTEGNELNVLKGAEKLIARDHPELIVEYTSLNTLQFNYYREEIVKLLRSWGYNRFKEVGREDLWATVTDEPRVPIEYLLTGTGGCGTMSAAQAFIGAGYKTTHEGPFNFSGVYPDLNIFWTDIQVESSWMAAYHLQRFTNEYPDTFIIHLVRHPFRATEGIHDAGMIHSPHLGGYVLFCHNALPTLHDYKNSWDKTAHFVIEWNKRIEPYADLRWKIEDGIPGLMVHLGIEWDESLDQKWHASGKVHPKLERGMIADELWKGLEELRERYSY